MKNLRKHFKTDKQKDKLAKEYQIFVNGQNQATIRAWTIREARHRAKTMFSNLAQIYVQLAQQQKGNQHDT